MKLPNILLIALLVHSTNALSSSYALTECILPPIKYRPAYIQANNIELNEWRNKLNCRDIQEHQKLLEVNQNIKLIDCIRQDVSESYRCFQYAIETITGHNGYIEFPEKDRISIDLAKYFQQTPYPKKNDLIIYTPSEQDRTATHFAVAINRILFKSKSGKYPQVAEHPPFDVIASYGKTAWSFELKPEYQGMKGGRYLLENIRIDITKEHNKIIDILVAENQQQLITHNNQKKWTLAGGFALGTVYWLFVMLATERYLKSYLRSE